MPEKLTWTTEPPKKPGWYWTFNQGVTLIAYVSRPQDEQWAPGQEIPESLVCAYPGDCGLYVVDADEADAWAGPVLPPDPPALAKKEQ